MPMSPRAASLVSAAARILAAGLVAALATGCPLEVPVAETPAEEADDKSKPNGKSGPPKVEQPAPGEEGAADEQQAEGEPQQPAEEVAPPTDGAQVAETGEVVPTDPIQAALRRIFSRRIYLGGYEVIFAPGGNGNTVRPPLRPASIPRPSRLARGVFRMLMTDEQQRGAPPGHGVWKLFGKAFGFGGGDVQKILLDVRRVEVRKEGVWSTVVDFGAAGQVVDLIGLQTGTYLEIGAFQLAPGVYDRARIILAGTSQLVIDEGHGPVTRPLGIWSKSHETIDLVRGFEILDEGLTSLRIDFDVDGSIFRFFGAYMMRPKYKVLGVDTGVAVKRVVDAAEGGTIGVYGGVSLSVPPGALAADTEITLRPEYRLGVHKTPRLVIIGHEVAIEPAGLQLNQPAELSMAYDPRYLAALGLSAESIDVRVAAAGGTWAAAGGDHDADGARISAPLHRLGRVVLGGEPVAWAASGACGWLGATVPVSPLANGLDAAFFDGACARHRDCYDHGFATYGTTAAQCDEDFGAGMQARCEALRTDELASDDLALTLYAACKTMAARAYDDAVARRDTRYAGEAASTCEDYDGVGLQCAPATCSLTATPASVLADVPSDLSFALSFAGSVTRAEFEGQMVYQRTGVPTPVAEQIDIHETARVLASEHTFTARVFGMAGTVTECHATVHVIHPPKPCTMTITPDTVTPGGTATLFITVLPGYDTAYLDLRGPGSFNLIGLSAPGEGGKRFFSTGVRPGTSRDYTARVVNGQGQEATCSAHLQVGG